MLTIFWGAWKNNKQAIFLITPHHYVKDIYSINYKQLKQQGIKHLIFDIDNTIMPVNETKVTVELEHFFEHLKKEFTICLLSNNKESRVKPVAEKLQVKGIANASKPTKTAYKKIKKEIQIKKNNTAMIGDQMLSDIVFGNKYELVTILVEPYKKKYDLKTGISRILQTILMKK